MGKSKDLISIIIINWNGEAYLKTCLPSIYKQSYKNIEVIVVDNASIDGSIKYIKSSFPQTKIIKNDKNYGFAEGNNIGYRTAKGKYILFLNNDTKVVDGFLQELVKVVESDEEIGGAQSKILLMDDPSRLDSVGAYLTNTGFLYHYGLLKKDNKKYDKIINLYTAKGASMLFKKEVLEKIKINDEIYDSKYFLYFEETDMCHRVWLAGYRIVFAPKSIIYHKVGGSSTRIHNAFIQYHSFKNRINSYLKNLELVNILRIMPVHLLLCEGYSFYFLCRLDLRMFLAIQRAILWNISNFSATLRLRTTIQNQIRKVKDKDLDLLIKKQVTPFYLYLLFRGKLDKVES